MDGHGCDGGGHHGGGHNATAGGAGDVGYAFADDGKTPIPNIKRIEINGAPVIETKNEFVMKKSEA